MGGFKPCSNLIVKRLNTKAGEDVGCSAVFTAFFLGCFGFCRLNDVAVTNFGKSGQVDFGPVRLGEERPFWEGAPAVNHGLRARNMQSAAANKAI